MRVLFVGAMSPGRKSMLDGLQALDIEAAFVSRSEDAAPLFDWCDIILFATSERSEMGKVRRLGEGGKPVAVILRPEDKGLAPLGLEAGAQSVFVDDVHPEEISRFIYAMSEQGMLRREVRWFRTEMRELGGAGTLIGQSAAAERVRRALKKVSRRYRTVLIRGEKGSNFIRHARAAHAHHPGLRQPFLHWEAARRRPAGLERALGRLEGGRGEEGDLLRRGGSLFVEDAQNLSKDAQKRLAGAMGAGEASPDFHMVLSHAHDPERLFQDEILPELHEKSDTLLVRIPPLRERRKDVPELAGAVLDEIAGRLGLERRALTPGAMEWLTAQPWWGNEAELEVTLWRAYLLAEGGSISLDELSGGSREGRGSDLEGFFKERLAAVLSSVNEGGAGDLYTHTIRSVEKPLLELVLRESGGNQLRAARILGMNRNTLRRKLQDLGILKRRGRRR